MSSQKHFPENPGLLQSPSNFIINYYHRRRGKTTVKTGVENMFKSCCKKDDVGPSTLRLSSYREEGSSVSRRSASSEMSNVSRRGLTDVSGNVPVSGRGLYDMSNIELPPLPPRGGSYREGGVSGSRRSDVGKQPAASMLKSRSHHWDEGSASRRKSDVGISGSRRKSDAGSASRRRSNAGKEPAQTSSPSEVDNEQAYAEQCHMCAETLNHFNNLAIAQWGVTYELVDTGVSVGFMHSIRGVVYHSNFHAKRMYSEPGTPTMLFFAELYKIYPYAPQVNTCNILGPTGSYNWGLNGCKACSSNPDRPILHHPNDASFDVGEEHFLLFEDDY